MRLKLISCEIFHREMCAAAARSPHTIDIEFLPKGLHDLGQAGMIERLQQTVDAVDAERYETVLLGYGLCNNGVVGLISRALPLVIPRAHDCITLFFGSAARYLEYFDSHPGTYFLTTGWIERGHDLGELQQLSIQHRSGMDMSYEEMVARYGEDNARYLAEQLGGLRHYGQYTYIEMGIEPDGRFERAARDRATDRGWQFDKVAGDMALIQRLVNGPWDSADFLTVPPGHRVTACYDGSLIAAQPASSKDK